MHARHRLLALSLTTGLLAGAAAETRAAELRLTTSPERIVLGRHKTVTLEIRGLAGTGAPKGAVNIGRLLTVEERGDYVRVRYRTPRERFPQQLCLLLWREGEPGIHLVRAPLHGRTTIPVRTRRNSKVELTIADDPTIHVRNSGRKGRTKFRVVVPPGPDSARVVATDRKGMQTEKRVPIRRSPYNRVALATRPNAAGDGFEIGVGLAEPGPGANPELVAHRVEDDAMQPLALKPAAAAAGGLWTASWTPERGSAPQQWLLETRIDGAPSSHGSTPLTLAALPPPPKPEPVAEAEPPPEAELKKAAEPKRERFVHATIGLGAGLMHNLGEFFAPHIALDVGAEFKLPVGHLGAFGMIAASWSSQDIVSDAFTEPATSKLLLLPIGIGATYRLSLWAVTPYIGGAFLLQMTRTQNDAPFVEKSVHTELTFGGLFFIGADVGLGPGRIFAQVGYQWSKLDSIDVEGLAGGILFDIGYRFVL